MFLFSLAGFTFFVLSETSYIQRGNPTFIKEVNSTKICGNYYYLNRVSMNNEAQRDFCHQIYEKEGNRALQQNITLNGNETISLTNDSCSTENETIFSFSTGTNITMSENFTEEKSVFKRFDLAAIDSKNIECITTWLSQFLDTGFSKSVYIGSWNTDNYNNSPIVLTLGKTVNSVPKQNLHYALCGAVPNKEY
jgi:hypothetical protein